jgi:hypothetical protein
MKSACVGVLSIIKYILVFLQDVFSFFGVSSSADTCSVHINKHVKLISLFTIYYCYYYYLLLLLNSTLRFFENRVLRRIFGPKRDELTQEWRKLHIEELNDLYCSLNIVRVVKSRIMRWVGHVASMGERWNVYRVLVGEPERKRPLERPRHRWQDNIKMDLQDWMELAQDRDRWRTLVNAVMKLRVP